MRLAMFEAQSFADGRLPVEPPPSSTEEVPVALTEDRHQNQIRATDAMSTSFRFKHVHFQLP